MAEIFIISAFGFPTVSIPIMVLIGTITDAPATVVNVTGDTGFAMVIARLVEGKDWLKKSLARRRKRPRSNPRRTSANGTVSPGPAVWSAGPFLGLGTWGG